MKNPFKVVSSKEVYKNPWIEVREDEVIRPDGQSGIFGVVTMVPGSTVVPLDSEGNIYLTEEYKYGFGAMSTEVISGAIDEGETPLEAAQRELREEAGLVAEKWTDLSIVNPFTTVVNSPNHIFLAEGLEHVERQLDEGEVISVTKVPLALALEKVMSGDISHAASCVAILKIALLRGIKII